MSFTQFPVAGMQPTLEGKEVSTKDVIWDLHILFISLGGRLTNLSVLAKWDCNLVLYRYATARCQRWQRVQLFCLWGQLVSGTLTIYMVSCLPLPLPYPSPQVSCSPLQHLRCAEALSLFTRAQPLDEEFGIRTRVGWWGWSCLDLMICIEKHAIPCIIYLYTWYLCVYATIGLSYWLLNMLTWHYMHACTSMQSVLLTFLHVILLSIYGNNQLNNQDGTRQVHMTVHYHCHHPWSKAIPQPPEGQAPQDGERCWEGGDAAYTSTQESGEGWGEV